MKRYTSIPLAAVAGLLLLGMIPQRCQETVTNNHPWLTEAEFQKNPLLNATADQVVVFDLEARPAKAFAGSEALGDHGDGYGHRLVRNTAAFLVRDNDPGMFSFCIAQDDPYIAAVEVETAAGRTVWRHRPGEACRPLSLPAGRYRLHLLHDPGAVPPAGVKAFLHRPQQARLLGSSQNDFTAADWFTFKGPNGNFVGLKGTLQSVATEVLPFEVYRLLPSSPYEMQIYGNGELVVAQAYGGIAPLTAGEQNSDYNIQQIHITDLGGGQFTMGTSDSLGQGAVNLGGSNPSELVRNFEDTTRTTFTVGYKVFECDTCDSAALPLQEGEVALFAECNYQGPAYVFQADIPDLSIYDGVSQDVVSPVGIGDNQVASVRVGPNALAVLFDQAQFGGTALGISADTPCLDATPLGSGTASSVLITTDITRFVIAANACENCNLTGIDLSGANLSDGQFSGSNFSQANLTDTNFQSARLDHADFTQATVAGTDFTGAVLDCTQLNDTDLASAVFGEPLHITEDYSCRLDLGGATLPVSTLPLTAWRYLNLTRTTIVNDTGSTPLTLSTMDAPLDLSGAILSNADGLTGAVLEAARMGCATGASGQDICTQLIDTNLSRASLQKAVLTDAALNGANLGFANLTEADLSGAQLLKSSVSQTSASLEGAALKNANLAEADLSGVNLANANWYSTSISAGGCPGSTWTGDCASGEGAALNSANAVGAYLAGLDLNNSTPQGANFNGAVLVGVNFTNANLSRDPNTGFATSLSGAFIQGADFSDAIVTGTNFTNAYVDLTGSGLRLFQLPDENLKFAGFSPFTGSVAGCVEVSYPAATTVPVTTSDNVCPDGNDGICTDSRWQSPSTPIGDAPPPSTADTVMGLPGGCNGSTVDFNWILQ